MKAKSLKSLKLYHTIKYKSYLTLITCRSKIIVATETIEISSRPMLGKIESSFQTSHSRRPQRPYILGSLGSCLPVILEHNGDPTLRIKTEYPCWVDLEVTYQTSQSTTEEGQHIPCKGCRPDKHQPEVATQVFLNFLEYEFIPDGIPSIDAPGQEK